MPGVKGKSGGHNRTTNNEKIKLGVRRDRINPDAPEVIKGEIIKFDYLYESELADKDLYKKIHDRFCDMLVNNGTLSIADSLAFHRFCRIAADWFKYDAICRDKGRMIPVTNKDGVTSTIPAAWHKIERDLDAGLDVSIRALGLSPSARDTIKKISENKPVNRWAIK